MCSDLLLHLSSLKEVGSHLKVSLAKQVTHSSQKTVERKTCYVHGLQELTLMNVHTTNKPTDGMHSYQNLKYIFYKNRERNLTKLPRPQVDKAAFMKKNKESWKHHT